MLMPYFHSSGVLKSSGRGKSVVSQSRAFLISVHSLLL